MQLQAHLVLPGAHRLASCAALRSKNTTQDLRASRPRTARPSTSAAAAPVKQQTLFTKLGGAPAVNAAVDLFYDKMLADARVSYFFDGIDMKKQRAHQVAFLSFAMGGAEKYAGNANMTSAHARLVEQHGLRMEHFDITLQHLGAALQDLNVPKEEIAEAAATVETLRPAFQEAIDAAER